MTMVRDPIEALLDNVNVGAITEMPSPQQVRGVRGVALRHTNSFAESFPCEDFQETQEKKSANR